MNFSALGPLLVWPLDILHLEKSSKDAIYGQSWREVRVYRRINMELLVLKMMICLSLLSQSQTLAARPHFSGLMGLQDPPKQIRRLVKDQLTVPWWWSEDYTQARRRQPVNNKLDPWLLHLSLSFVWWYAIKMSRKDNYMFPVGSDLAALFDDMQKTWCFTWIIEFSLSLPPSPLLFDDVQT